MTQLEQIETLLTTEMITNVALSDRAIKVSIKGSLTSDQIKEINMLGLATLRHKINGMLLTFSKEKYDLSESGCSTDFAKIFKLKSGEQGLITKLMHDELDDFDDYDNPIFKIEVEVRSNGITAKTTHEYDSEEKRDQAFLKADSSLPEKLYKLINL